MTPPSIDRIRKDDQLLDSLGGRSGAGDGTDVAGMLQAWVDEIDREPQAASTHSARLRRRLLQTGAAAGVAFAGLSLSSVAAAVTGAQVPVLHQLGTMGGIFGGTTSATPGPGGALDSSSSDEHTHVSGDDSAASTTVPSFSATGTHSATSGTGAASLPPTLPQTSARETTSERRAQPQPVPHDTPAPPSRPSSASTRRTSSSTSAQDSSTSSSTPSTTRPSGTTTAPSTTTTPPPFPTPSTTAPSGTTTPSPSSSRWKLPTLPPISGFTPQQAPESADGAAEASPRTQSGTSSSTTAPSSTSSQSPTSTAARPGASGTAPGHEQSDGSSSAGTTSSGSSTPAPSQSGATDGSSATPSGSTASSDKP
ncbi:hypothetical protein [Luteipulveratus halotolerans]|uniref:hypothetical protein n=1 Tax=Luteipulveratus halotolerans TaxID=1631356 RepID=UPI000A5842DB|nr:hypothetical protein [Luteipulveratus halotolerans]